MGQIVALDSMVFIYWFEQDERFILQVEPWFTKMETGKIEAITSIVSPIEVLSATKFQSDPEKLNVFTHFFSETENLTIYDVNWEIGQEAAKLRREHKSLHTPDAIQLATALVHKADIFVTNDIKLQNLSLPNLKILSLSTIG